MAYSRAATVALQQCDPWLPEWLSFVQAQPQATIFHHPAWLSLLASTYRFKPLVLVNRDSSGCIAAGVPLIEVARPFSVRRFVALPFTDSCPPLARNDSALASLSLSISDWRRKAAVEVRGATGGYAQQERVAVLHVLRLSSNEEATKGFRKATRTNIRDARRAGVETEVSHSLASLQAFYRLHSMTRRKLGVPVQPWRYMRALWKTIIQPGLGFVAIARHAGKPIAAAVFLAWNGTLIYKYSASDPAYRHLAGTHIVISTAIEWACQNGYRALDFGRSDLDQPGLRHFKAGWGAAEVDLLHSYWPVACKQSDNGFAGAALRRVIQASPTIVCRALGEALYRYAA